MVFPPTVVASMMVDDGGHSVPKYCHYLVGTSVIVVSHQIPEGESKVGCNSSGGPTVPLLLVRPDSGFKVKVRVRVGGLNPT